MQVVKGDQNRYLVPVCVAGPPFPKGYKYGGLVPQVGVWATDRQPVDVKKLLGNLNCGHGTERGVKKQN
jgi:hypothetical protein